MSVNAVNSTPASAVSGTPVDEKKSTVSEQYAASSKKTKETIGALLENLAKNQYASGVGQGLNIAPPSMGSPAKTAEEKTQVSKSGGTEVVISAGEGKDKGQLAEAINEYGEEKGIAMFESIKAEDIPDDVIEAFNEGDKSIGWLGKEVVKSAIAGKANQKRDELGLRFGDVDRSSISNDTAWGVIAEPKLINETKTFSDIWGASEGAVSDAPAAAESVPVVVEESDQAALNGEGAAGGITV